MNDTQKTIVLTGASRGIGHATAKRFWNEGWRVITCARQAFPKGHPGGAPPENHVQIDLGNRADLLVGIEKIRKCLNGNPLNALVNNAAVSPKDESGKRLGSIETDLDMWDYVFQVNFFSPIMLDNFAQPFGGMCSQFFYGMDARIVETFGSFRTDPLNIFKLEGFLGNRLVFNFC